MSTVEISENKKYDEWVNFAKKASDSDLLEQLVILSDMEKKQLFVDKSLAFGTAGVRTKVGLGPILLNVYNVYRLGLAYAAALTEENKAKGVAVFHDTRDKSIPFSETLISALVEAGVKNVHIIDQNRATITPFISYAIRTLGLGGGIMVTASHNPADYQGMKFYNEKGIQISDVLAKVIETKYLELPLVKINKHDDESDSVKVVPSNIMKQYYEDLKKLYGNPKTKGSKVKILLTSLQGASAPFVERLAKLLKLDIDFVEKEKDADPLFKVAQSTNPEKFDKAYNNALSVAFEHNYDALVAIDPDGDRLGVVDIKEMRKWIEDDTRNIGELKAEDIMNEEKPWCLSGNKVSALLFDQKIHELKEKVKKDPKLATEKHFIVRTHVTGNCVDVMAKKHGIEVLTTFTGFKWVGSTVDQAIVEGKKLVMGFEESIGYFFSDVAREKDSLQALICLIKLLERLRSSDLEGGDITLTTYLQLLYSKHGYFLDKTDNIPVKISKQKFIELAEEIRTSQVMSEGSMSVEKILDPTTQQLAILVLHFANDGGWIAIRPSGTEPKVKVYYVLRGNTKDIPEVEARFHSVKKIITDKIDNFITTKNN